MVLAHPSGDERDQREPEEQVQVGPEDLPVHAGSGLEQVVVVVPIDAEEDVAQHVGEKEGQDRPQRRQVAAVRRLKVEHHDGDEDGDHAVAERFEAAFGHGENVSPRGL